MTLQLLDSEFPYISGKFDFVFTSVGASTAHQLNGGGPVWANQLCGSKQLEQDWEGLGSRLRLHHDSPGTRGDDAVLFYRHGTGQRWMRCAVGRAPPGG